MTGCFCILGFDSCLLRGYYIVGPMMLYRDTGTTFKMGRVDKEFDVSKYFEAERVSENRIFVYQGSHFRECFVYRTRFIERPQRLSYGQKNFSSFVARTLTRDEVSSAVWGHARQLYGESCCIVTIAEICEMVALQKTGLEGNLLTDFRNNIFFVRDAFGQVRIVHVRYSKKHNGWGISCWFVEKNETNSDDVKWLANHSQFIFRDQSA